MYTTLTSALPVFDLATTFDQFLDGVSRNETERPRMLRPAVDIGDDAENYFIEADLPGLKMEDIDVTVNGRDLTISGERKVRERKDATYRRRETFTGRFERVFHLPESADTTKVQASLASGVLTVCIPKAETAKPRRIEVQTG